MLPDLGRLIRLLYATVAAAAALRIVLGRWRPTLATIGGLGALALMPDGVGGHYVGTAPWPAALAMQAYLAAPSGPLGGLAGRLLERRWGRLYHLDAGGTRRLIAAGLPPVFAIARAPTEGALAGPPARIEIQPIPTGPDPAIVSGDVAAP